jgi:hypothetical protein
MVKELQKEQHSTEGIILQALNRTLEQEKRNIDKILYERVKNIENWTNIAFVEGIATIFVDKKD